MRFEGGDLDRGPARADGVGYTDDKPSSTPVASLCEWPSPITGLDYTDDKPSSTSVVSLCDRPSAPRTPVASRSDRPSAPRTPVASRSDRPSPITGLDYTDDKTSIDPVELSPPLDRAEYRDIGDQHKTASDHKECSKSGSIKEADKKLNRLIASAASLEPILREGLPYELRSAQQLARRWVPKAIVVCDALEASLTASPEAPEKDLMTRGELSAHVLKDLHWESLGAILGLDRDHPSLPELRSKICDFIEVVEAGDVNQDLSEPLKTLAAYHAAVDAVRGLRNELRSVAAVLATPEADNITEVVLGKPAPIEAAGSLAEAAMRIGGAVLVGSAVGPLGAAIFHDPLLGAAVKAGISSLIGSTTIELLNHGLNSKKLHSPEAVFGRCHDQLLTSLGNYGELTAGANLDELVVARANLTMDSYAARLATIRLDWPDKDQYWETIERLQGEIDRSKELQKLGAWSSRLHSLAQNLKDQRSIDEPDIRRPRRAPHEPANIEPDIRPVTRAPGHFRSPDDTSRDKINKKIK
jgi:hypothetical protein